MQCSHDLCVVLGSTRELCDWGAKFISHLLSVINVAMVAPHPCLISSNLCWPANRTQQGAPATSTPLCLTRGGAQVEMAS